MKYLWKEEKKLKLLLENHTTSALFLDFDGTLTPIVDVPSAVVLTNEVKNLLKALSKDQQTFLTIISGRSIPDLFDKVALEDIIYAGNHGLEWKINDKYYFLSPQKSTKKTLDVLRIKLSNIEKLFSGAFIEDKGLTLSVHYRLLEKVKINAFKRYIKTLISPFEKTKNVSLIEGKKILDICPRSYSMKGRFCRFLLSEIGKKTKEKPLVIYIGDDTTDEDVFLHLEEVVSVHVGKRYSSRASYYLHDPSDVIKFLQWVLSVKSRT